VRRALNGQESGFELSMIAAPPLNLQIPAGVGGLALDGSIWQIDPVQSNPPDAYNFVGPGNAFLQFDASLGRVIGIPSIQGIVNETIPILFTLFAVVRPPGVFAGPGLVTFTWIAFSDPGVLGGSDILFSGGALARAFDVAGLNVEFYIETDNPAVTSVDAYKIRFLQAYSGNAQPFSDLTT
jgi:hypothetical protein